MAHPTRSCAADRRRRAGQYVNTANRRQPPTTSSLHSSSFPSLSSSSSSYLNAAKMRLGFEIREGDDLYQFIAATAEERDEWMAEIKTIIRDYMRQQFGTSVGDAATLVACRLTRYVVAVAVVVAAAAWLVLQPRPRQLETSNCNIFHIYAQRLLPHEYTDAAVPCKCSSERFSSERCASWSWLGGLLPSKTTMTIT